LIQNESNAKFTLLNKDNTTINYLSLNKNEENKIINIFEQQITNIGNSLGNVIKTTDENDKKIEVISLGIKELDDASGIGGLPVGRIIEMFSKEIEISQDVILKTIISAQKNDKRVAYIDMDNSLDLQKAKQAGLESKNLLLAQPTCGEQVFDLIESLTKTNMIDLIVVNNVGAMNSKFNTADERLDVITNQTARMMSKGLRAIQPLVAENKTALVFLNEPAQKENMFFDQEHLYGGRALRFYSTQRIELRKLKNEVQAKFVKNKLATPLTKAIFALNEDKNLDHDYSNTAIDVVENKENNTLELVDKNNKRTETNTNEQLIEEEKQNVVEQGYIVGKITKIADETLIIENNYIGYEIPKNNIKSQENPYKSRNSSLNDLGKAMRSLGYNQIEIDAVQKIDFDNTHELSDMISISIKAIAKYGSFNEEFNERK
jgi:recombination protein RecA